jgi:hypothetical protein
VYRDVSSYNLLLAYLATIVVYIILGIYLKGKIKKWLWTEHSSVICFPIIFTVTKSTTSSNSQMAKTRQIYKSLAMIMCVIFLFYFVGFVGLILLVPLATNDPQMASLLSRLLAEFIFMAGAVNAPVLYFCRFVVHNFLLIF